ncbi:MAG TPA: high frequency lysogenization protein HflD [Acidiferrobacterales bacterium]|nr:high frequency lysogenization protein HflD [Acidiferrobacterales bacterium]
MAGSFHDQVLALAGVFQSACLVQQLAREGHTDSAALRTSIQSVLALDAPDVATIYGGARGVHLGLELLTTRLTGKTKPSDMEMARYVIALVQLEGSLRRRPKMLDDLRQGIDTAREQMKFFEGDAPAEGAHPQLMEKLAQVYSQTISTLTPRIMVSGEHGHLANPAIAAKVRATLLAGIRSAVLWRQLGGRRWQLLFSRGKIARAASALLAD